MPQRQKLPAESVNVVEIAAATMGWGSARPSQADAHPAHPAPEESPAPGGESPERTGKSPEGSSGAGAASSGFALRGVDLVIPKASLTAVVGSVGQGKSTLLLSIIGELEQTAGEVRDPRAALASVHTEERATATALHGRTRMAAQWRTHGADSI